MLCRLTNALKLPPVDSSEPTIVKDDLKGPKDTKEPAESTKAKTTLVQKITAVTHLGHRNQESSNRNTLNIASKEELKIELNEAPVCLEVHSPISPLKLDSEEKKAPARENNWSHSFVCLKFGK